MTPEPNRIDLRFAALREAKKKAFMPFLTAGFPNLDLFPRLLESLPKTGADLIEIGMPFSDPMADGPAIQAANIEAFKAGITTAKILEFVAAFREKDKETPIILMGYYNPIYAYGVTRFLDDAKKAGVDGFIIPDLPPEEDEEFREPVLRKDMRLIRLVAPTTDEARLPAVLQNANGFLYYVAVSGTTGAKSAHASDLLKGIERIKAKSDLPVCIGFGINTPAQAAEMAAAADGAIVASAIMKLMAEHIAAKGFADGETVKEALAFIASLAKAVHGA